MKKTIYIPLLLILIILACDQDDKNLARSISYESEALGSRIELLAYIPQSMNTSAPVLYFLDESSPSVLIQDQANWQKYANDLKMVIVLIMINDNIYKNYPGSVDRNFEDYVLEVIDVIDALYDTKAEKSSRGITGVGYGGGGALSIARHYPEKFGSVSAISPTFIGYDIIVTDVFDQFSIKITAGDEDFSIETSRGFHSDLLGLGIEHSYKESSGYTNWRFWQGRVEEHLIFHSDAFKK